MVANTRVRTLRDGTIVCVQRGTGYIPTVDHASVGIEFPTDKRFKRSDSAL